MRIAVTGAYGNGKTTLVAELSQQLGLAPSHGSAMRDPLGAPAGTALEDCTPAQLIQLTIRRYVERAAQESVLSPGGFVSDGSVLHEWIYTTVRLTVGRHPGPDTGPIDPAEAARTSGDSLLTVAEHVGLLVKQHTLKGYDLFVHLPAEIPLRPETRPISEHFRALSDRLLLDSLAEFGLPVHIVTGSLQQRLDQVLALTTSAVPGR
jgi:AAA domain